jgi:hypothetical protein
MSKQPKGFTFKSIGLALSAANRARGMAVVTDGATFWLVTMAEAERAQAAGYSWVK